MRKIIQIILFSLIISVNVFSSVRETISVQVSEFPPCVIIDANGSLSGFDIELWNAISSQMGYKTEYQVINPHIDILQNLKDKKTDVGISGFTITKDREEFLDFSQHYFDSGLRILVLKEKSSTFDKIVLFWNAVKTPVVWFLGFMVIFAHLIWIFEKDNNPDNDANAINDKYFPGIFEAIYFCFVTCSTVGYGDYTPKKWIGRIVVIMLIIVGIIAFCNFTALLSSKYTTEELSSIKTENDLNGKSVITQTGTSSVFEFKKLGARVIEANTIEEAYKLLLSKRGDAFVFDAPVIMEYAKKYSDKVMVVGDLFDKQYYGFALQQNSSLREGVNKELLSLIESGEYQKIYNKWFKN
jgi:polar amino acid transport system substrate-binding protein